MPDTIEELEKQIAANAVPFFVMFSRFEYALKRTGYLKKGKRSGAEPHWDKLAKTLGQNFFEEVCRSDQVSRIFEEPPRKQVVNQNDSLDWKGCDPPANSQQLIEAIRRIRNNLFHGGKYPSGPLHDPIRNQDLLTEALWVLCQALERCPKVKCEFDKPLDD